MPKFMPSGGSPAEVPSWVRLSSDGVERLIRLETKIDILLGHQYSLPAVVPVVEPLPYPVDMASSVDRTPQAKTELLAALEQRTDGAIARLFIAHRLGQAYSRPGRRSSKSSRIASAMTEAERRGDQEALFDAIAATVRPEISQQSHATSTSSASPDANSPIVAQASQDERSSGIDNNDDDSGRPVVASTPSGRRRLLIGGTITLVGLAATLGVLSQPPSYEQKVWGLWLIPGTTLTAVGLLIYTQTLGHRGSTVWRAISRTTVPGAFLATLGLIANWLLSNSQNQGLETVSLIAIWLGTLWAIVGPFLIHKSITEQLAAELSTPRADSTDGVKMKEIELTRGDIYIIVASIFQGVATLTAALYA